MKTLKTFKISENKREFDIVELLYDNLNDLYYVRWKWTTMRHPNSKKYVLYADAIESYRERKHFAIICN